MIEKKVLYESMILPENSVFAGAFKNTDQTKNGRILLHQTA
jgi:hypothetical protein